MPSLQDTTHKLSFTTSGNTKHWHLSISGNTVLTNQTTLPSRPFLENLFYKNGYGEKMAGQNIFCACSKEGSQAAFKVFKSIIASGVKR